MAIKYIFLTFVLLFNSMNAGFWSYNTLELTEELKEALKEKNCCKAKKWTKIHNLIKNGADYKTTDIAQLPELHQACITGDVKKIELLLQAKTTSNEHFIWRDKEDVFIARVHPLSFVLWTNQNKIFDLFVKYKAFENYRITSIESKEWILAEAIKHNQEYIVKIMLQLNTNSNAENFYIWTNKRSRWKYFTPLTAAASLGHLTIVKLLMQNGAEVTKGISALHVAAAYNQLRVIKFLLSQKININEKNGFDETALYTAVSKKADLETIKFLIAQGADIHILTHGTSMAALAVNQEKTFEYLISQGCKIISDNKEYKTKKEFNIARCRRLFSCLAIGIGALHLGGYLS